MEVKIPFYNLVNMFFAGLVFMGGCAVIYPNYVVSILTSGVISSIGAEPEIVITVCAFAVAYEVGLIINRIGSVLVEPALKKIKAIPFNDDYVKFNEKKKEYPILNTLSREFAVSRTGIALFVILMILALCDMNKAFSGIFAVTVLIYFLSCRKHAKKIVELMSVKIDAE